MKMKTIYRLLFLMAPAMLMLVACEKSIPAYEALTDAKEGARVFVARANNGLQNLTIFPYTEERIFRFNAGFGAVGLPASDIPVTFTEDSRVFDSLNVIRSNNGLELYERFPKSAYNIDALSLTIPKGGLSSDFATLTYRPNEFNSAKDYLLALSITDASGYAITPSAKSLLIVAPKLESRRANTAGWVASASTEQPTGENTGKASAVLDGDLNTIWHARYTAPRSSYPHWLSFDMLIARYVTKISMAPRQNNANGFTKFKLEGSLDGTTWFSLGENLTFNPGNIGYQDYPIEEQYLRNIRITMLEGLQDLSFLAEFAVYAY